MVLRWRRSLNASALSAATKLCEKETGAREHKDWAMAQKVRSEVDTAMARFTTAKEAAEATVAAAAADEE